MNTQSNALPQSPLGSQLIPAVVPTTRPMYWSILRELWEYRSIYLAPLAAAAVYLFGFLISTVRLPHKMRSLPGLDPAKQYDTIASPYHLAMGLILGASFIVGIFYCLDALHGERRDRSILFWKSLPVSDLTTVLSKAFVAIVLIQLVGFVITVATQWIMLLLSSAVLLANGLSVATLWTQVSLFRMSLMLLYHLVTVHMLWYAPIYAWLLLVSGWARRGALLWAILPPLAIGAVEKIALNTQHFADLMLYRFTAEKAGGMADPGGFPVDPGVHIHVGAFLSTPGLWIGLIVAAVFLAAAVRLRRYREPI